MQEEEDEKELQKREKKKCKMNKKMKESGVTEESIEYGEANNEDIHSQHAYFNDSNGAENSKINSVKDKKKKKRKEKKGEGSVNVDDAGNDRDVYSPNVDFADGIEEVKAVVKTKKGNNNKEKEGRGKDIDNVSDKKKMKLVKNGAKKDHTSVNCGEVENVKMKKVTTDKEAKDGQSSGEGRKKEEFMEEEKKVFTGKDVGKYMDDDNGKYRDKKDDVKDRKKVRNRKEVRNSIDHTSGKDRKKVENANGTSTDSKSPLAHTLDMEPLDEVNTIGDERVASNKDHIILNGKDMGKREKKAVEAKLEKHGKKRRKQVRKGEVEFEEPSAEETPNEVSHSGQQAKDEEVVGVNDGLLNMKKRKVNADQSTNSQSRKKSKSVSFSGLDEVFPFSGDIELGEDCEDNLIRGKRFSLEEDKMIKEAVSAYIEAHGLGEQGLHMVLHCRANPEVKGCWKEIGAALPWRPYTAVYYRAHILYERSEHRKWDDEDLETLRRYCEQHGSNWKELAIMLGRHRFHVKDTWRRIKVRRKRGPWSQDEYQTLFELVNKDLQMKAFEEKKTKHGMLRDNISWEAISDKLSTRNNAICCTKWYNQLASPMVAEGIWNNSDDYRLVAALMELDASCVEDVHWDSLIDNRPGNLCLKRWNQMTKHIGEFKEKSFSEQIELLSTRYCPKLLDLAQ